ncbi:MAG: hypothetical protein JW969_05215 [Spirochaetales bacterium]|nr:hypothetical protein [Spirochaetales bacterium]
MENGNNLDKYLDDIRTIKDLLLEVEEQPLVESWAFFVWGALFMVAGIFHYIADVYLKFTLTDLFFKVWIPLLILTGTIEAIAFFRIFQKESIPLLSRRVFKLFVGLIGACITFAIFLSILHTLNAPEFIPVIVALFMATYFTFYAHSSYKVLYIQAILMYALALILFFINVHNPFILALVIVLTGISFIFAGITVIGKQGKK